VPKPGHNDYSQAKAFRPISLTLFLLKTLERLIDRYIRDSVLLVHPLQKNQHAYQAGKSTKTALHSLVTRTERTLEQQEYALGVFLDIKGAFVQSLQSILHSKGVNRTIIRWISFMLSCRSATASLGNVELCVALLKGFPQGGVLSALFGSL